MINLKTTVAGLAALAFMPACTSMTEAPIRTPPPSEMTKANMPNVNSDDAEMADKVELAEVTEPAEAAPNQAPDTASDMTSETLMYNAMTQWEMMGFLEAVKAANLEAALEGDTVYTVFAPNSDAFTRAGGTASADLLKAHIVAGSHSEADLKAAIAAGGTVTMTSLAGTELKFYNFSDALRISGPDGLLVSFAGTERAASNGVLHQITSVIAP